MTLTDAQIQALTDEDLESLLIRTQQIRNLRMEATMAEERIDDAVTAVFRASGKVPGDPWVQPTGLADAYPRGVVVTHGGTEYLSTRVANRAEPGTTDSGWVVATAGTEWSSTVTYPKDAIVTYEGNTYVSLRDNNIIRPGGTAGRNYWALIVAE